TLHSRTGFEDWEEIEKRRMLLRLWLKGQPARPLVENQKRYYGEDGMHVDGRENTIFDPNRQAAE
ncbi:MAG: hypothetical protein P8Q36_05315, partial [Alphaproteobacteria bacterium]|nr:hypothetical protein [Alphaproteobacteria bacterium]